MIDFNSILPVEIIRLGGIIILVWIIAGLIYNLIRWRPVLGSYLAGTDKTKNMTLIFRNFSLIILRDIFLQNNLWKCNVLKWFLHFIVFWGFIGLGVSTTLNYLMNPLAQPLPLSHPVRIIGNISGIFFMLGLTLIFLEKMSTREVRRSISSGFILFMGLLFTAGLTGFLTEIFSELNLVQLTTIVYWAHIISVAILLILFPFSKFIHSVGRSLILLLESLGDELRVSDTEIELQ